MRVWLRSTLVFCILTATLVLEVARGRAFGIVLVAVFWTLSVLRLLLLWLVIRRGVSRRSPDGR